MQGHMSDGMAAVFEVSPADKLPALVRWPGAVDSPFEPVDRRMGPGCQGRCFRAPPRPRAAR